MAINFLNSVDLNQNQLIKAAIESQPNDAAVGTGVEGQLYFNTTQQTIKVYREILPATTPKTYEWASISGDIEEVQASVVADKLGIDVVDPLGPIPKVGLDIVGLTSLGAPALTDTLAVYDVSATTNKKLTVADIIGTSSWELEGDGANPQTIVNGDTVDFVGDTYITATASSVSANNFKVNFDHNDTSRTDTALPAGGTSPGYSGTFDVVNSVSTNATGHVTAINVNSITLPAELDEKYTLPTTTGVVSPGAPTTGIISLTGSTDGVVSTVTFTGTTNRIDVSGSAVGQAGAITIDLTDDVTIVDDLTVGGIITQSGIGSTTGVNDGAVNSSANLLLTANNTAIKVGMQVTGTGIPTNITIASVTNAKTFVLSGVITIANSITITFEEVNSFAAPLDMNNNRLHEVKTGVLGTDGVNLGQVNSLIAGVGVFKGGYDASTDPGAPKISGGSNVALDQGDYFVVTSGGNITFSDQAVKVEVGDFIFAEQAIAASSTPASTEYIIVIADANIATAGTLNGVGAAQRGVAGFDATTFAVTTGTDAGFVTLKPLANPYGAKVALTGGDNTTAGQTTFTVDVTALFTGADARNCKVEVLLDAGGLTVYPEVTRNGSGDVLLEFMPQVGNNLYSALITIV